MRDYEVENNSFFIGPQFLDYSADWVKLFFNNIELKKNLILLKRMFIPTPTCLKNMKSNLIPINQL